MVEHSLVDVQPHRDIAQRASREGFVGPGAQGVGTGAALCEQCIGRSGPHRQHRRDRCAAPLARVPHGYTRLAARQLLPDRIGEAGHEDDGEGLERQELHGDGIERGSVGYEHDFPGHGRGVERAPRRVG